MYLWKYIATIYGEPPDVYAIYGETNAKVGYAVKRPGYAIGPYTE